MAPAMFQLIPCWNRARRLLGSEDNLNTRSQFVKLRGVCAPLLDIGIENGWKFCAIRAAQYPHCLHRQQESAVSNQLTRQNGNYPFFGAGSPEAQRVDRT